MPFAIGHTERDQWLACMDQAMQETGVDPELRQRLRQSFFQTADWMVNQNQGVQKVFGRPGQPRPQLSYACAIAGTTPPQEGTVENAAIASQMHYILSMKSATLPSIRVEPEFRTALESLLRDSETLTEFVEHAVRETVQRRRNQAEFLARGILSLQAAKRTGDYVDADVVLGKLHQRLAAARSKKTADRR